ncbi:MAG: DNA integrity scanning diadenylate cyclase DisA [archaeon]
MHSKIIQKFESSKIEDYNKEILELVEKNQVLDIFEILPLITPGSNLRKGLDEILCGDTGALIVLGENNKLEEISKGGFKVNLPYSSSRLFELSKMDGAIILSNDLKTIVSANIHLMPNKEITSSETGIRHRSAEQTAKQTDLPVIAVSKRRGIISYFYSDKKYVLQDLNLLISKANQSMTSLKNYRSQIDQSIDRLTYTEFNSYASRQYAVEIIQKMLYFFKHRLEIENIIIELGEQGKDFSLSIYEDEFGLDEELSMIIMDYSDNDILEEDAIKLVNDLKKLDLRNIADLKKLAEEVDISYFDNSKIVSNNAEFNFPRGYRLLYKLPKIDKKLLKKIVQNGICLSKILNYSEEELISIVKLDKKEAKYFKAKLSELNEAIINKVFSL